MHVDLHVCLQPNRSQAGTWVHAGCWRLLMHRVSAGAYFSPFFNCWIFPSSSAVFIIISPSPTCVASPTSLWKHISLSNLLLTVKVQLFFISVYNDCTVQCTDYSNLVVPVQCPSLNHVFKKRERKRKPNSYFTCLLEKSLGSWGYVFESKGAAQLSNISSAWLSQGIGRCANTLIIAGQLPAPWI